MKSGTLVADLAPVDGLALLVAPLPAGAVAPLPRHLLALTRNRVLLEKQGYTR